MRFSEIKQSLFEINMSPGNLEKLASTIDAKVGIEFEMIYPITDIGSSEDEDLEIDFSRDEQLLTSESANWNRRIMNFFYHNDEHGMNDEGSVQSMIDEIVNDFHEWWDSSEYSKIADGYYDNDMRNLILDWWNDNQPDGVSAEEFIENQLLTHGRAWNEAYGELIETLRDEIGSQDWREFFSENGLTTFKKIYDRYAGDFDVYWPYMTQGGTGATEEFHELADGFSEAIGRPVNISVEYHSDRVERDGDAYIIEPDSSLKAEEFSNTHMGLEFVSPPLSVSEMIGDFEQITAWAKMNNAYSGQKYGTGLHINVSVKGYSRDNLDFVKLALLMGDEHILTEFQREANKYCQSALGIVKSRISRDKFAVKKVLDAMKDKLSGIASRAIHNGSTEKFTSINTKSTHVEFRSPGGDWIREFNGKIPSTILRFVVALDAACDPEKYRKEYLTKLYKLLSQIEYTYVTDVKTGKKKKVPVTDDTLEKFTKYVAGEIPYTAFKAELRFSKLQRDRKKQDQQELDDLEKNLR